MKRFALVPVLASLLLAACGDDTPTPAAAPAPTPAPSASNNTNATSPTTDAGSTPVTNHVDAGPTTPPVDEPAPVSTFCAAKIKELGAARVVFCSDFDDARALSAFEAGAFLKNAFEAKPVGGGTAKVDGGSLFIHKPANGGIAGMRGAVYSASIAKYPVGAALHISMDVKITRAAPDKDSRFFGLGGAVTLDAIDRVGTPILLAHDTKDHDFFGTSATAGTSRDYELDITPSADNAQYNLFAKVDEKVMKNDTSSSMVAFATGASLQIELAGTAETANDGEADYEFDNVIIITE